MPNDYGVSWRDYVDQQFAELKARMAQVEVSLSSLNLTRAELAGKATQNQIYLAYLISAIGIILAVVAIIGGK